MCERVNRTIINKLRCLKNEQPRKSWVQLLKTATEQYNNTIHCTTKFPPYYLLTGRTTNKYINDSNDFPPLQQAREEAKQNILESHRRNKKSHDSHHKACDIKEGDLVYTRTPPQKNLKKLSAAFEGPWKVLNQVSPTVFEIDKYDQQNHQSTTHYHSAMLKRANGHLPAEAH